MYMDNPSQIKIEKKCMLCGNDFKVLAMAKNRTTRCHECYLKNPIKVSKICERCGISYDVAKSLANKSRFHNKSCKAKFFSENKLNGFTKGEDHYMWKGGVTPIYNKLRKSRQYRNYVLAVFFRDDYTCQICGKKEVGRMNANHIKKFSEYPDLRTNPLNGITLCPPCHKFVTNHEAEWESYFNFNLATRGYINDEFLRKEVV